MSTDGVTTKSRRDEVPRRNILGIFWVVAVGMICMGIARGSVPTATAAASGEALGALQKHLGVLKGVNTLEAKFVCEKRLAMLDSPLVSSGRLWIRKGSGKGEGGVGGNAVRFSTETPYESELILAEGKAYGRSQHETEWAINSQSARPGLTAVMQQLGGWSTGDAGNLTDFYAVTRGDRGGGGWGAGDAGDRGGNEGVAGSVRGRVRGPVLGRWIFLC